MEKKVVELKDINALANDIISASQEKLMVFKGDLGSGKTTLIKALIQSLGIKEQGSSPSFSLINVYENEHCKVYHCDLYRLKSYEEALDIGLEDYLADEGSWCLIEWPEIVEFLLPKPYQLIELNIESGNKHAFTMKLIE